ADRIAVIDHGRVIADDTADGLKNSIGAATLQLRPADRADAPRVAEIVEQMLGEPAALSAEAGRVSASLHRPDLVPDILIAMREQNITVDEINVQKPSLDEVFMTLTGKPAETDADTSTDDSTEETQS
ncbi:MAG TPA: daunorubicin/doxorubicin resistance ABC transporter ATP-binding protein DrrA, partial [Gordonia polyisoprenivorans]|nr:daunorubicin/doxorubicin resistance ABC transporter ATP-binding protein DrrA [Gordonia polyisoprenivorans]